MDRKNLIVDIDRVFLDIIPKKEYDKNISTTYKTVLNSKFANSIYHITDKEIEYVVILRNGAQEFFKSLSKFYILYVVTAIYQQLTMKLLDLIDPESKQNKIYIIFEYL